MKEAIERTFRDIVAVDSTSKNESNVASYLQVKLTAFGVQVKTDSFGNVIGILSGEGEPVLLNAHMDGVSPGRGHSPIKDGETLKSDGTTNLRADDAAGITIILEAVRSIREGNKVHPPMVLAFTVQEEIGLWGAKALDLSEFGVNRGIVYDNAFKSGTVVSRGAAYIAFDVEITGRETHPGKDLLQGVNSIKVLLDTGIELGSIDNGRTRVNIGTISGGKARNIVPGNLMLQGEIRSFLTDEQLTERVEKLKAVFEAAADRNGATVAFSPKQLAVAYEVSEDEPLLRAYKSVIEKRGGRFQMQETFVASDANTLRGEKGLKVFVVSTGVVNEHTLAETVNLAEMEQLTTDLIALLELLSS